MITTVNMVTPDTVIASKINACIDCVDQSVLHTVKLVTEMRTQPMVNESYFDAKGIGHVHTAVVAGFTYQCSNGHTWSDRFIVQCPACGWTIDTESADS